MTPEELLRGWVKTYGPISTDWSRDFIARPEVKKIVEYRDANVVACVRKHKRLVDILNCLEADGKKAPARRPAPIREPTRSPSPRYFPNNPEKPKPGPKPKIQSWGKAKEATVNFDEKHRPDYL